MDKPIESRHRGGHYDSRDHAVGSHITLNAALGTWKRALVAIAGMTALIVGGTLYASNKLEAHAAKVASKNVQEALTKQIAPKVLKMENAAEKAQQAAERSERAVEEATKTLNRAMLLLEKQRTIKQ